MNWKLAYAHHDACKKGTYGRISELEQSGFEILAATVPGNFEIDLMREGKLDDLYFSTNTLEAQKLEDVHVWYYTEVEMQENQYLRFEGIDTFADIYVNGELILSTNNMFLPYEVKADWKAGKNEVVVHIKPTMLEARKYVSPAAGNHLRYNAASLYVRKAAHMFGWDIMPRIVSAGLWKDVLILEEREDRINEVYLHTNEIEVTKEGKTNANMRFYINAELSGPFAKEYNIKVEGRCGESSFLVEDVLWHNTHAFNFDVHDCLLWWPKNAGKQNLYDVTVTLLRGEQVCDTYTFKAGIRTVELDRTEITDEKAGGEFCFLINHKKIFALGTNWVPLDALHSQDGKRLDQALALLDDIGCNMVRCWGGNVYETEEFFDFCDTHGILVWQDFGMGCVVYPDDELFAKMLEEEAVYQIKRLRNHVSLSLWAGDNECDMAHSWSGFKRNPNRNRLTREVLRRAVELHDYSRPYLPSSPYQSNEAYEGKGLMPENHLWGPRDYFKGNFYKNTFCHFASETGYHAFNSPVSLRRFLKEPEKIFREDGKPTDEYIVHATDMELGGNGSYTYRIPLAYNQVVTLFGTAKENLDEFVCQSQISQAEAKKYFIEKFRIGKWNRTGIIWWNLLDGWPQVSDAIVDYYFVKKLAYHYVKRSQEPVCLMFDEPENGHIRLVGANDLPMDVKLSYTVKRIKATDQEDELILSGEVVLAADTSAGINLLPVEEGEKEFYLIEWKIGGRNYKNHFFTNIIDIDYDRYMNAIRKCGMDQFEGF